MNATSTCGRITFEATKKNKTALVKYTSDSGRSIKVVMNNLLERFLVGEIDFKSEVGPARKRIKGPQ